MAEQITLEQQNIIRERLGLPPLTELPPTPEEIEAKRIADEQAAKIEAKKKEDDAEAKRLEEENRKKGEPVIVEKELNDDVVLEYLQKKNPKIKSFEAITPKATDEEVQAEKDAREADKLAWALKQGKFKKKEYENFINDSKNPNEIVFAGYSALVKSANPDIEDDQIRADFNERYGLDKDPESWQYKMGQKELAIIANQHLQKNYGSILSLENEYSTFEQSQNQKNSAQAKILANAPSFKKDVEAVFGEIGTYKRKIDGKEYEVKLPDEFVGRIKNQFLSNEFVSEQIQAGWNKDALKELAQNTALIEHQDFIAQKVAEEYLKEKQKGARGIVAPLTGRNKVDTQEITDENQRKAAERHGVVPVTTS